MSKADLDRLLVRPDGFLPKERYTTTEFSDLELDRLWPRVWQIAGREEELAAAHHGLAFGHRVGHALQEVGDVEIHAARSSGVRYYSPILA